MNKTRGGVGILAKPFKILKDDAANKSATCSSGHRTGNGQFSFQSQRAISKNVQTTIHLDSFHMLERLCSKSFKLDLQYYIN